MKQQALDRCVLFGGLPAERRGQILDCLTDRIENHEKGEFLLLAGETPAFVGLVLTGSVHILREDFWGARTIVGRAGPGELFAESFALAGRAASVSVQAAQQTQTALLSAQKLCTGCAAHCDLHDRLLQNLIGALAEKNLFLSSRCGQLSARTIEERLLDYLSAQAAAAGEDHFDIPFDRQQLADYLCCDRSALSARLSKMQAEGLLQAHKNHFVLCKKAGQQENR